VGLVGDAAAKGVFVGQLLDVLALAAHAFAVWRLRLGRQGGLAYGPGRGGVWDVHFVPSTNS
jgi:hypothetical protein